MTAQTISLASAVAADLVEKLPTTKALIPTDESVSDVDARHAVTATFVGAESFDLAVAFSDESILASAGTVSLIDLLHNALTDATVALGRGTLSNVRIDDATSLLADEGTDVVALSDGEKVTAAFGLRHRASTTVTPHSLDDVTGKLGRINNVEMALTVEIGRTRLPVRDVLSLEPGAIVELDRSAGAPADILLNGRLIAYGEIVVVDQDYAVRVTQILDTSDALA